MNVSSYLNDDFVRLDTYIHEQLYSGVPLVREVAQYIVQAGGKRLRPAMLMLTSDVLGLRHDPRITSLAAVVEFIHTATLLHDDVVDESGLRRGKPTANAVFGNAASVLVGDFLYSRAFQMMVKCNNLRVMEVLADATNVIAEGEVLQLIHIGDASLTHTQYLKVIEYKTAKLFEAAARLPAVIAGNALAEQALADYGRKIGAAFQIVDDVLDYTGDTQTLGKNLGDDLREGKVTLPLIFAMQNGSESQRKVVTEAIEKAQTGNDLDYQKNMTNVLAVVHATQSTQAAQDCAIALAASACSALAPLPHSQAKTALIGLADMVIRRST